MTDRPKRKTIPAKVKLQAVLRVEGRCRQCGERLGPLGGLNFDHRPALENRDVNEDGTDYVPAQLDPEYIEPLHIDCHKVRTHGPGGERRITTAGSDNHIAKKTDRLAEAQAEMRRRILATEPKPPKPKSKWPKRPFPKKQRSR